MKKILFVLFACLINLLVFADEFQRYYIEAMKAYDTGDSLRSYEILDSQISKHTNVPLHFYIKSIFYIKDAYYIGRVKFEFLTNVLYRYYNFGLTRNIQDEYFWEQIAQSSFDVGVRYIFEESVKNLLFINII
ncbi:MAG: hypothetical protein ACK4F9_05180 [Brevinematia bacterium]